MVDNLRISTSDDKDFGLELVEVIHLPAWELKERLILQMQVKILQLGAEDPDLPLQSFVIVFDREEKDASAAPSAWRLGLERNRGVYELLWMGKLGQPCDILDLFRSSDTHKSRRSRSEGSGIKFQATINTPEPACF